MFSLAAPVTQILATNRKQIASSSIEAQTLCLPPQYIYIYIYIHIGAGPLRGPGEYEKGYTYGDGLGVGRAPAMLIILPKLSKIGGRLED